MGKVWRVIKESYSDCENYLEIIMNQEEQIAKLQQTLDKAEKQLRIHRVNKASESFANVSCRYFRVSYWSSQWQCKEYDLIKGGNFIEAKCEYEIKTGRKVELETEIMST